MVLIISLDNSVLSAPMFLVSGARFGSCKLANGPVVTNPSPLPRNGGEKMIFIKLLFLK